MYNLPTFPLNVLVMHPHVGQRTGASIIKTLVSCKPNIKLFTENLHCFLTEYVIVISLVSWLAKLHASIS